MPKKKGKRPAEASAEETASAIADDAADDLHFQDDFVESASEEEMMGEDDEMMGEGEEGAPGEGGESMVQDGARPTVQGELYRAGGAMGADETLDYDSTAYTMLHRLHFEWPALSFGVVRDNLGDSRTKFPMTAYVVAGTQADQASQNKLVCSKLSHLAKTQHDEDSDSGDDSDEDNDDDPLVEEQSVRHEGGVNRLKLMPQSAHICATWADTGAVHIHDLSSQLSTLAAPGSARGGAGSGGPTYTFRGHADEGFALDFSPVKAGALATGDCASKIHTWAAAEGGAWAVDAEPYVGHTGSVEDVAWSPAEPNVLMSCGCDSTVRVWDVRRKAGSALTVDEGHGQDVNVLSWNKMVNYLVVTGADDGSFRVWDLRSLQASTPVAKFHWHKAAVTSVEWSPHESSTIAVSGADDQLTLWDLALEEDPEAEGAVKGRADLADIPPQLFFVHQGQRNMKEVHWHAQMPGVLCSTAEDSFHIFKPANAGDVSTDP